MEIESNTDVLIIGGGIAGCIAAIALVAAYRVTLVDKLEEPLERVGESLAPAAQRILKRLGLLEEMETKYEGQLYVQSMGMQSYWGSDQVQFVDNLRNPDGFGRNLNRKAFEAYLREIAVQRGVQCRWPAKLHSSEFKDARWQVVAKSPADGQSSKSYHVTAKYVIDASGRQSHFARNQGVSRQVFDKLIACWAILPNHALDRMGIISASELGWWYSAPVPNNKRVLSFQTDADLVERSAVKDLEAFIRLAKSDKAILEIVGNHQAQLDFRGTVAANSTRLEVVAGQQWAAIGDAAISFDPLSSQGMFHAMASAMQFAEAMIASKALDTLETHQLELLGTAYTQQIQQVWEHYLRHKNLFYRAEMRWKDAPFWRRRQE